MRDFIPFKYRDFYDFPRLIVVKCAEKWLLLDSQFDDAKDDYSDSYEVYVLPASVQIPQTGSWEHLISQAERKLGTVKVVEVTFDSSRRKKLDPAPLLKLLAAAPQG